MQTNDGTTLVPSFQFDLDLEPRQDIAARTARLVQGGMSAWAVWRWWTSEHPLPDRAPVDALNNGRDDEVDNAIARLLETPEA